MSLQPLENSSVQYDTCALGKTRMRSSSVFSLQGRTFLQLLPCKQTHKGVNHRLKDLPHTLTQQQRPESAAVTLTWHSSKYKVYQLHEKCILHEVPQKLCESGGGPPGLPVPNSPYGLCGRKATLNLNIHHKRDIFNCIVRCLCTGVLGRFLFQIVT